MLSFPFLPSQPHLQQEGNITISNYAAMSCRTILSAELSLNLLVLQYKLLVIGIKNLENKEYWAHSLIL